jgi:hypothetical protein
MMGMIRRHLGLEGRPLDTVKLSARSAVEIFKSLNETFHASGNGTSNGTSSGQQNGGSNKNRFRPHDNYSALVNGTIWFLTGLALIFLCLRLYCKLWRHRRLWWDDCLLIMSWVCNLSITTILNAALILPTARTRW